MRVLLVDDHPLILSALQAVIEGLDEGVTVVGVDSAAKARAMLAQDRSFELVLLDLWLGDADGFEVLAELRQTYPTLPVVVISATERHSDVVRAVDALPIDFRMVVILADLQEFSYKEIADILDIPVGTVMSRLFRGRRLLEKSLLDYAAETGHVPTRQDGSIDLQSFRSRRSR